MVAPNRRNGGAQFLLLLVAVISLALASPAPSLQNLKKQRAKAKNRLLSTTTTTPAPSNELTCEEKFKNAEKFTFNETALHSDIRKLMNTYYDWGALLAPAPVAISVLGKLIIMSTQRMDFPIDVNLPTGGFKHIKYPKSFRTTLLQISHSGYLAFLKAHTNMDKIRMYNSNVPSHIKEATRYLMSKQELYIVNLLPISLGRIKEAADQSKELSQEVVKEFKLVVELIQETILAVSDTKSDKEVKLKGVELDIKLSEISRNFSENESKLLEEKSQMLSGMLNSFGYRQKNIFIRTIYGNENFVINLSKEWLSQTEGRHLKHREIFFSKNDWLYSYTDERVETDKCIEQNNQQLLDLIIVMGQYRLKYESWQNSDTFFPFSGAEDVGKLEMSLNSLIQCSTVNVIVTNLSALMKRLQNVKFEMLQKTSARPGAEEMDGLILTIKNLRSGSTPKTKKEDKSTTDGFSRITLMEGWSKVYHQQFDMLQSMINVTADIMKVNNKQMELRRQKTQQVLEKLKSLDITKISYKEAIQALQEGMEELGNLKTVWTKLIDFYSKMSIFITKATEQSIALIEIVRVIAKDTNTLDDDEIFGNLLDKVQKANEASFLVYGVSDMYVNVSDKYIMDRIASLDSMMNIDASKVGVEEIMKEQQKLIVSGEEASKGIVQYIKADETSLREKLVDRHNEIMNEYQWMIDCTPEDRDRSSLSSKNKERKELKTPGTNQTAPPSSYPMENANSTADTVTETSSITTLPILVNTSDSTNSTVTNTTLSTSSPISDTETAGSEAPLEAREHVAWHTEDLLVPAPKSVHLLAQLMALSMSQIDTAFRGSSQRNQSVSIQYNKSFRTTMQQISQKLNNALSQASTNSETIATSLLNAPEKLEEAFNYLKRFKNSSRNANFLVLLLKSLKDATDQTINLSNQVVSQLSGLVRLADEIIETVDSSKTEKVQQREAVLAKLQSTQTDKSIIENETFVIEKEIEQLKREVRLHKMDVEIAIEDLKNLRSKANDESRCYWSFSQKEGLYYCPYRPQPSKIREADKAKEEPQKLFESAMKRLSEKEKLARDRREKDNKLLITMKKLFADKGQLADDIQLLEKSRTLFTRLVGNFTMLEKSWDTFASICKDIQEGAARSHATVVETIENPSSWNNTLADELGEQLKDTQENLSLLKTIVQSYLEGYARHIVEIVAEAEQMMTKRGHPQELERRLLRKCEQASRGLQSFIQSNSQLHEADSQITQRIKIIIR